MLGVVFVILLTGSIQSISADHTEPGIGIFKDATNVSIVDTEGSKYKIFMHAVIRNIDGHLITTIENTANGAYIPHKIILLCQSVQYAVSTFLMIYDF